MTERWAIIEQYPDYEVSDLGRVRRVTRGRGARQGAVLKAWKTLEYPTVQLYSGTGKAARFYIHDLVAAAFLGKKPNGYQVNHKDGNKSRSELQNIEYVTRSENALHALATGLKVSLRGEMAGRSKLTERDVIRIRQRVADGEIQKDIATEFSVSRSRISLICSGRSWSWL